MKTIFYYLFKYFSLKCVQEELKTNAQKHMYFIFFLLKMEN